MNRNQERFISGTFIITICLGFILGKVAGGTIWWGLGGMLWSYSTWWIGAVVGHMYCNADSKEELLTQKKEIESDLEEQRLFMETDEKDLVYRELLLKHKVKLGPTRLVIDRVVNRILSKWVPNLSDEARMKCVVKDVEKVILEEIAQGNLIDDTKTTEDDDF